MAASVGRDIIFRWGGVEVPGVRQKGIALNGTPVDITSDDDDGWRALLSVPGQNEVTLSIGGVTKSDALKADWFAGSRTKTAEIEYPDGKIISGSFSLSTYTDTGPYNDATTFEAEILSTGVVTYT